MDLRAHVTLLRDLRPAGVKEVRGDLRVANLRTLRMPLNAVPFPDDATMRANPFCLSPTAC